MYKERVITRGIGLFVSQERLSGIGDDVNDDDVESALCMASLQRSGENGNDNRRSENCVFSTTHVAYTWHNIDVHTSSSKLRRRGFWYRRRDESTAGRQSKHILKNGECLRRLWVVFLFFVIRPVPVNDRNRKSNTGCFFNAEMGNTGWEASSVSV